MDKWIRPGTACSSQAGFSLVGFLVRVVVLAVLVAIAVPSYLWYRDRADSDAARTAVHEALPAVEAFYAVHRTYSKMTLAALRSFDEEVELDRDPAVKRRWYCIQRSIGDNTWRLVGPGDPVPEPGACPVRV